MACNSTAYPAIRPAVGGEPLLPEPQGHPRKFGYSDIGIDHEPENYQSAVLQSWLR